MIACALAAFTGIICIAGFSIDSGGYSETEPLKGCYNTDDGKLYGDTDAANIGILCALDDGNTSECLCQESSSTDTCYEYYLEYGSDCGKILDEYPRYLLICISMGVACMLTTLAQTLLACINFWCVPPVEDEETIPVRLAQTDPPDDEDLEDLEDSDNYNSNPNEAGKTKSEKAFAEMARL